MEIRPTEAGDRPALSRFFERIPESDRTFLKEDVGDPRVIEDWVKPGAGRTVAIEDGEVVGSQAVLDAVEMGLKKLVVEVIADQAPLIAMFRGLGFEPEALLTDHVRDRSGQTRDLIVLANSVDEQFATLTTAGIADQLQ